MAGSQHVSQTSTGYASLSGVDHDRHVVPQMPVDAVDTGEARGVHSGLAVSDQMEDHLVAGVRFGSHDFRHEGVDGELADISPARRGCRRCERAGGSPRGRDRRTGDDTVSARHQVVVVTSGGGQRCAAADFCRTDDDVDDRSVMAGGGQRGDEQFHIRPG